LFWPGKEAALISKYHVLFQAIGVQFCRFADYDTLTLLHDKADFYTDLSPDVAQIMDLSRSITAMSLTVRLQHYRQNMKGCVLNPLCRYLAWASGFRYATRQHHPITQGC